MGAQDGKRGGGELRALFERSHIMTTVRDRRQTDDINICAAACVADLIFSKYHEIKGWNVVLSRIRVGLSKTVDKEQDQTLTSSDVSQAFE